MKKAYLECGKIINTHGFRGTVKLESWCDHPDILANLKHYYFLENGIYRQRCVSHASVFRQFVLADIEGVDSEDAANALRGTVVYAAREELPLEEGDHFIADLIGLDVRNADTDEVIGKLADKIYIHCHCHISIKSCSVFCSCEIFVSTNFKYNLCCLRICYRSIRREGI